MIIAFGCGIAVAAAKMPPELYDELLAAHDEIKNHPSRLRIREEAVAEAVYERQQAQLTRLYEKMSKIKGVSKDHLSGVRHALSMAESAYHGWKNGFKGERIQTAVSEQETALMTLHQILREQPHRQRDCDTFWPISYHIQP